MCDEWTADVQTLGLEALEILNDLIRKLVVHAGQYWNNEPIQDSIYTLMDEIEHIGEWLYNLIENI